MVGVVLSLAAMKAIAGVSFTNSAMGTSALLLKKSSGVPVVYLAAAAFLSLVAIAAIYLPAYRAASIEPMKALRTD
jgi:ABC-type antimicrobial peptide transport system permease subunit